MFHISLLSSQRGSQRKTYYQNGIVEVSDGPSKDYFNGKFGSKGGRKGGCLGCNKFGHYVKECPKVMQVIKEMVDSSKKARNPESLLCT